MIGVHYQGLSDELPVLLPSNDWSKHFCLLLRLAASTLILAMHLLSCMTYVTYMMLTVMSVLNDDMLTGGV